jgi:hypothetical protein
MRNPDRLQELVEELTSNKLSSGSFTLSVPRAVERCCIQQQTTNNIIFQEVQPPVGPDEGRVTAASREGHGAGHLQDHAAASLWVQCNVSTIMHSVHCSVHCTQHPQASACLRLHRLDRQPLCHPGSGLIAVSRVVCTLYEGWYNQIILTIAHLGSQSLASPRQFSRQPARSLSFRCDGTEL